MQGCALHVRIPGGPTLDARDELPDGLRRSRHIRFGMRDRGRVPVDVHGPSLLLRLPRDPDELGRVVVERLPVEGAVQSLGLEPGDVEEAVPLDFVTHQSESERGSWPGRSVNAVRSTRLSAGACSVYSQSVEEPGWGWAIRSFRAA